MHQNLKIYAVKNHKYEDFVIMIVKKYLVFSTKDHYFLLLPLQSEVKHLKFFLFKQTKIVL